MQAWKLNSANTVVLEKNEAISPAEGFVKVKIQRALLSNVDILMCMGKVNINRKPITLGHHAVGIVSEVGEGVKSIERGDRVVFDSFVSCNRCSDERELECCDCTELKMYGMHEDGFFSDFVVVKQDDVFKLPERVEDDEAIFAPHVAFAVNAVNKLNLKKGEHVVIMGASVTGVMVAQLALYYQAIPILVDPRQERLDNAENLGVYYCINSVNEDVKKKIFTLTGGSFASAVVYFPSGTSQVSRCLDFTASGGRVCIAGWNGIQPDLMGNLNALVNKQLKIFGVNNGAKLIPTAINMLATKTVSAQGATSAIAKFADLDKVVQEELKNPERDTKVLVKF